MKAREGLRSAYAAAPLENHISYSVLNCYIHSSSIVARVCLECYIGTCAHVTAIFLVLCLNISMALYQKL